FLPANVLAGVGGGWYDAFPLPDGCVGLAVGDVACHGAKAATLMGELRNALRAYALEGDPPATVASKMWHFVETLERGEMATFLYAVYDPTPGSVTALAEELLPLRRQLRRWLAARGANEREIAAITLATQEACANAVEHAYGLADATFHLAAVHDGPAIEIVVRDRGQWRPPRGKNRGRGMALMRALVDDVEVTRHDGGTTVRLLPRLEKSSPE